ncbi:MAG: hypothetical protein M3Z03_11150 [Actinomycetota bacterium]|nr:hypothetical protein [Actinomycetota bacterium]
MTADQNERRISRRRALPGGRAALGGLLVTVAAVGVLLTYLQATDEGGDPTVVASTELRLGAVVTTEDLRIVEVDLPPSARGRTFRSIDDVVGRSVLGPVDDGELVQFGSVSADRAPEDRAPHEVAVTLRRDQLALGRLDEGDRVDLYVTTDDTTDAVAAGLRVVQLGSDGGSLTDDREITVVLAAPSSDVVADVVHAMRTGELTLVRSTFAGPRTTTPPDAGP